MSENTIVYHKQFIKKLYQWAPILLEKEAWKDIDSYLLFCLWTGLCLVKVWLQYLLIRIDLLGLDVC